MKMESTTQFGEISSQQITITKAKLLVDKECLTNELKLMSDNCDKMSLKINEQSKEINMLKVGCKKRLRDVSKAEDALQKQTNILTTLQEFLDTLVDKMNEYEERRVTRDAQIESCLNDLENLSSTHKSEMAESLKKTKYLEDLLQSRTNEVEEFQRKNNYLQLQIDEVNEELLQTVHVKVEEQNELKSKIDCLFEEKEDMIKKLSHLEDEKAFLQEKNVTLIENERNLQNSLQQLKIKSFQESEELKRQIVELNKLNEELDFNLNIENNDLRSQINIINQECEELQQQNVELNKLKEELDSNLNNQITELGSQINNLQKEFNNTTNALKEENLKVTKVLEESLANKTSYEIALKAELEDEHQNYIRVKLQNDTFENQIKEMTKESTEFQTTMLNLRERNFELIEKLKRTEDLVQILKRQGPPKRPSFNKNEIEFTTPKSNASKKSKPADKLNLSKRPQRHLSTDSDFSIGDESPDITMIPKKIKSGNSFFSQQVPRTPKQITEAIVTSSIDYHLSRNQSTE